MFNFKVPSYFNIYQLEQIKNKKGGFLLIEVIFSVFLVSVMGFYLASWYIQLLETNSEAINRSQALNLAASLVDKAKILKSNFSYDSIESHNKFQIKYNIKKYSNYFNLIEIKVSWKSYFDKTNSVKLVGGYVT